MAWWAKENSMILIMFNAKLHGWIYLYIYFNFRLLWYSAKICQVTEAFRDCVLADWNVICCDWHVVCIWVGFVGGGGGVAQAGSSYFWIIYNFLWFCRQSRLRGELPFYTFLWLWLLPASLLSLLLIQCDLILFIFHHRLRKCWRKHLDISCLVHFQIKAGRVPGIFFIFCCMSSQSYEANFLLTVFNWKRRCLFFDSLVWFSWERNFVAFFS